MILDNSLDRLSCENRFETFNAFHLGDNLIHINYLYRISLNNPGKKIVHYCEKKYLPQLDELMLSQEGNVHFKSMEDKTTTASNSWIGHEGYFYNSRLKNNWSDFHLDFFQHFSKKHGLINPITESSHLLFKFPILNKRISTKKYNFLVNNAEPLSGQCPDYRVEDFVELVRVLQKRGYSVITTKATGICDSTEEQNLSVLGIANLSLNCEAIIGVPNGPIWLTYNIYNLNLIKLRIFFVAIQTLKLTNCCVSVNRFDQIFDCLKKLNLI
jgi:hypothetical protein